MFRISKIFTTASLDIYKVEGKVTDETLQTWEEALMNIHPQSERQVLLDFSQVWAISAEAVKTLVAHLTEDMRVMNPGIEVRNTLHTAGLAAKVLE